MKTVRTYQTRFPEELRGETPFIIGKHGNEFVILFDGDVDGFQPMPRRDAENIVDDYVAVPINTFLDMARWLGCINNM